MVIDVAGLPGGGASLAIEPSSKRPVKYGNESPSGSR